MSADEDLRRQKELYRQSMLLATHFDDEIIPFLDEEVRRFEHELARFRNQGLSEQEFMAFRVRQGVYGQRQPNRHMLRVKIPGGVLTPEALEALAAVAQVYAPMRKGHLTTRQNIQFHHLRMENCIRAMRLIGRVGLTGRESCGNTVRNVVGPPLAGVCPDEVFDPTPFLAGYARFAARHPLTQNFPRKFKTSFTGCSEHDAVVSLIHDLSFVAQIREENGGHRRGFKVLVGGATSTMPRLAQTLYEFVPWEDYLRVSLAVWTVFNRADELRKHRMRARLKVLIERIGIDDFREQVDCELAALGPIDPTPLMQLGELQNERPPEAPLGKENGRFNSDFLLWKSHCTQQQRQLGYYAVHVRAPRGDLMASQMRALAEIVRLYSGGRARTTQEQNLLLRWVPEGYLYLVWQALKEVRMADRAVNSLMDVVSCPGAKSCKSAITSSPGLARAVERLLSRDGFLEDPQIRRLRIKISGCPFGCSQHHIAHVGFQGAVIRATTGAEIPAYDLFMGGEYSGKIEQTAYGERVRGARVPARSVPAFLRDILTFYRDSRRAEEEFNDFAGRIGPDAFVQLARPYQDTSSDAIERLRVNRDWDKQTPYKLERGEGECSA